MSVSLRSLLSWWIGSGLLCVVSSALAQHPTVDSLMLTPMPYVTGLTRPLYITHAADGSHRLFVVEQTGDIRIIKNQTLNETHFLDLSTRISCCGEQGLLGLAFPPDYATKRYFYVNYTDTSGDTVIARYSVTADPDIADPGSEEILLTIPQPFANHNGGHLAFGPDGYLYIGTGDGGSGGDPQNNGQNLNSLLGKILRIDVESGTRPYAIPSTNPLLSVPASRGEIWAFGLRNPWKFSFDRQTGDLYIGDVGQNTYEEIDFQPSSSPGGENYGWRVMEGTHCYDADSCDRSGLTLPIVEYDHSQGCSVTGGVVYRGQQFPRLIGTYLYGDYCSGRIWGLSRSPEGQENIQLFDAPYAISTFGEDEAGEVYLANYDDGVIYQIADTNQTATVDLAIITSDSPDPVTRGELLTYAMTISNNGSLAATSVQLSVTLPSTFTFQSATLSQGECHGTSTISCDLGAIAPGTNVTLSLVSIPTEGGGFSVSAQVSSHETDVQPENNTATAVTTVSDQPPPNAAGPDLTATWQNLTQRCKGSEATKKCTLKGALLITNQGQQSAAATFLQFYLSSDMVLDSGDLVLRENQVKTLKVGKTRRRKLKVQLPRGTEATGQFVLAVIDSASTLTESNEANNIIISPPLP